jgi:hypothetical protein
MSDRKPRADAKLKSLPPAQQEAIFALLREKSYAKAIPLIAEKFEVETSAGALSQFFAWYPLSRRLEQGAKFADELKSMLATNPKLTLRAEELSMIGQVAFEAQALQEQDPKLFVALRKLRVMEKNFDLEREKFRETLKTDVEKGLDALLLELKANDEALVLFERMKAIVLKSVERAK